MKLILNGKEYSNKIPVTVLENYIVEFKAMFEYELLQIIGDNLALLRYCFFNKLTTKERYKAFVKSPYSDDEKVWNGTRYILSKDDTSIAKGHLKGKQRPEHGAKIREKLIEYSNNRTDEHKSKLQDHLKNNFKRKRMINLGLVGVTDSDEKVNIAFSTHMSTYNKSEKYKRNKIASFLKSVKYESSPLFKSFISKYSTTYAANVECCYSEMMSIISSIAYMDDSNNMGSTTFFSKGTLSGLRYQCNGKATIKYKSSYEKKTIEFFEENAIWWEYEPFFIYYDHRYYKPDFLVTHNQTKYLLEIKGYIRDTEHLSKIHRQMHSAFDFCQEKKYTLVYKRAAINTIKDFDAYKISTKEKINNITL